VKVIDFGIAKLARAEAEEGRETHATEATERFGTPVYMSPEQLRSSADVDARADVWALGVVLYELIAGSLPFVGDGIPRMCTSILVGKPTPLSKACPGVPAALEAIVLKCLEKEREDRFASVLELAKALEPFGPRGTGRVVLAPARWSRTRAVAVAGIAIAALASVTALVAGHGTAPAGIASTVALAVDTHVTSPAPADDDGRMTPADVNMSREPSRLTTSPGHVEPQPAVDAPRAAEIDARRTIKAAAQPSPVAPSASSPKVAAPHPSSTPRSRVTTRTALFGERQ